MTDMSLHETATSGVFEPLQYASGNVGHQGNDEIDHYPQDDYGAFYKQAEHDLRWIGLDPQVIDSILEGSLSGDSLARQTSDLLLAASRSSSIFKSESYDKYKKRKYNGKCKKTELPLWCPKAEALFQIFILMIPPYDKLQIECRKLEGDLKKMGRNELIAHLLKRHNPPVVYERKNISSHIQVVHKCLYVDGNTEATRLLKSDVQYDSLIDAKGVWFDEATLTLYKGEVGQHKTTVSNLSQFLPGLQSSRHINGRDWRLIQSVDFVMGIYEKCVPPKLIQNITTLQTSGGAPSKPLTEIMPYLKLYPQLKEVIDRNEDCEIIWFETNVSALQNWPSCQSCFAIDLHVDIYPDDSYVDWKFTTSIYNQMGQPAIEVNGHLDVLDLEDSRLRLANIPLRSQWWVSLFTSMILRRKRIEETHKADTGAIGHEKCDCERCLQVDFTYRKIVSDEEQYWRKYFRELSIVSSIYATPRSGGPSCRLLMFLFKFRQSLGDEIPLTTWQRLTRPDDNREHLHCFSNGLETGSKAEFTKPDPQLSEVEYTEHPLQAEDFTRYLSEQYNEEALHYPTQNQLPINSTSFVNKADNVNNFRCASTTTEQAFHIGNKITDEYENTSLDLKTMAENRHRIAYDSQIDQHDAAQTNSHRTGMDAFELGQVDLDFAQVQTAQSSYYSLNDEEMLMENHLDFGHSLTTMSKMQHDQPQFVPQEQSSFHAAETSDHLHAPRPRRIISTVHLSSPIVMARKSQIEDMETVDYLASLSHFDEIHRSTNFGADNNCLINLVGHQDRFTDEAGEQESHSSLSVPSHHDYPVSLDGSQHSISNNQRRSFDTNLSRNSVAQSQSSNSNHSSTHQQMSLLTAAYEHSMRDQDHEAGSNQPEYPHPQYELILAQETHQSYKHGYIQVPSQKTSSATASPYHNTESSTMHAGSAILNNSLWSSNAAMEAHNWVVDLAIARTEDMIEEAHAAELDALIAAASAVDPEATAAMLDTVSQNLGLYNAETEPQTMGKVLGEVVEYPQVGDIDPLGAEQDQNHNFVVSQAMDSKVTGDIDLESLPYVLVAQSEPTDTSVEHNKSNDDPYTHGNSQTSDNSDVRLEDQGFQQNNAFVEDSRFSEPAIQNIHDSAELSDYYEPEHVYETPEYAFYHQDTIHYTSPESTGINTGELHETIFNQHDQDHSLHAALLELTQQINNETPGSGLHHDEIPVDSGQTSIRLAVQDLVHTPLSPEVDMLDAGEEGIEYDIIVKVDQQDEIIIKKEQQDDITHLQTDFEDPTTTDSQRQRSESSGEDVGWQKVDRFRDQAEDDA